MTRQTLFQNQRQRSETRKDLKTSHYFLFIFAPKRPLSQEAFFLLYLYMFEKVIKELKRINVSKTALEEFENNKAVAFDLNTEDQLFSRGVDSKGISLGSYAPLSVVIRSEAGLPVDRITLRVEGDFHDGWEGDFSKWPVLFTSSDSKTGELLFMFGPDIFGLTDVNINILLDEVLRDSIVDNIKGRLDKAFAML